MSECRICNGTGWYTETRGGFGYGEPLDYWQRLCDCRAGRRLRERERWERYASRMQDKRRRDRGLAPVDYIGF